MNPSDIAQARRLVRPIFQLLGQTQGLIEEIQRIVQLAGC
jgi:hypothetical protein